MRPKVLQQGMGCLVMVLQNLNPPLDAGRIILFKKIVDGSWLDRTDMR